MSKTLKTAMLISALFLGNLTNAQDKSSSATTNATTTPVASAKQDNGIADRFISKSKEILEQTGKTFTGIVTKYSGMMQVSPSSLNNTALYQFVDEWYGTKYVLGGTGKRGIDCSALVQKLYNYVYGMDVVRTSLMQFRSSDYIANKENLKEGDLVFFKIHGGPVSHVGIYLANNYFLHASSSRGVMISNLNEKYWTRVYVGGGRLKD